MPLKKMFSVYEPFRHVVKLRMTTSQLNDIDTLAAEQGVSRSYLLRQVLARGLPLLDREFRVSGVKGGVVLPRRYADSKRPAAPSAVPFRRGPRGDSGTTADFTPHSGAKLERRSSAFRSRVLEEDG